jgi:hypothetical protein
MLAGPAAFVPLQEASASPLIVAQSDAPVVRVQTQRPQPGPAKEARTKFVEFEASPFPFDGINPRTGKPFLNVDQGEKRAHRDWRGRVLPEDKTFSDPRVLLHIPQGFDVRKPGMIVIFFHGHRATIDRDVLARQKLADQISK